MSADEDSPSATARRRIAVAYSPQLFEAAGHRLAELLAAHFRTVQASEGNVLNWIPPPENFRRALESLRDSHVDVSTDVRTTEFVDQFGRLVQLALDRGHNLHDPRYVGHQVPATIPIAGLFEAIGSATNQPMAIYEMGPWSTSVEQALITELTGYIGWNAGSSAGILTHGASLANLTALLVARNVALPQSWEQGTPRSGPPPVLISQADAHYCISRSAGILGLGTDQVVKVPLDARRRMDPAALAETITRLKQAGHPIIAVVACACATPIGAFDPLEPIADLCERHGIWLHVDAAHGGAALMSPRYRHLLAGIERADSLTWDAHKMLFVPALCAFLFYRNKQHSYEAFRQNAPYLFDPTWNPEWQDFESGLRTIECTKRAAAFGLWGVWSMFGPQLLSDLVETTFDLGRVLYDKLEQAADFVALHEPQCNILVFRHVPAELQDAAPELLSEFQWKLRTAVVQSGEYYVVPTMFNGVAALRVTLINPLTTADHLDNLLDTLRRTGRQILQQM